jgi:hypothetical protein
MLCVDKRREAVLAVFGFGGWSWTLPCIAIFICLVSIGRSCWLEAGSRSYGVLVDDGPVLVEAGIILLSRR